MTWRTDLERLIQAVPSTEVPDCLGELQRHAALLWLRLQRDRSPTPSTNGPEPDKWLTPKQVMERYNLKRGWVYSNWHKLGGKRRGRLLRIPKRGLERYFAAHG